METALRYQSVGEKEETHVKDMGVSQRRPIIPFQDILHLQAIVMVLTSHVPCKIRLLNCPPD